MDRYRLLTALLRQRPFQVARDLGLLSAPPGQNLDNAIEDSLHFIRTTQNMFLETGECRLRYLTKVNVSADVSLQNEHLCSLPVIVDGLIPHQGDLLRFCAGLLALDHKDEKAYFHVRNASSKFKFPAKPKGIAVLFGEFYAVKRTHQRLWQHQNEEVDEEPTAPVAALSVAASASQKLNEAEQQTIKEKQTADQARRSIIEILNITTLLFKH